MTTVLIYTAMTGVLAGLLSAIIAVAVAEKRRQALVCLMVSMGLAGGVLLYALTR